MKVGSYVKADIIKTNLQLVKREFLRHESYYPNSAELYSNVDEFVVKAKQLPPKCFEGLKRIGQKFTDEMSRYVLSPSEVKDIAKDLEFFAKKINEKLTAGPSEFSNRFREKMYV